MITHKPEVNPLGLYNQKQAAEALQVNRHTIARYERAGLIRFRVRKAGMTKVVSGEEIIKCWKNVYL